MSWFSALSSLSDSFSDVYHESAEMGLMTRMGDSMFSSGSNDIGKFGENMTNATMSSSFDSGFNSGF